MLARRGKFEFEYGLLRKGVKMMVAVVMEAMAVSLKAEVPIVCTAEPRLADVRDVH